MKNIFPLIVLLFLFVSPSLKAQDIKRMGIPVNTSTNYYKPLTSCRNPALEASLAQKLKSNPKWNTLIKQKKLAISLVDLSNIKTVRYAEINGKEMMYAASLPKIAVLLAAMDAIEKCELEESEKVLWDMHLMISKSNNQASTRMIDRLGYRKISSVLTNPRYKLYDKNQGGGLWVGKRYAASGKRYPDPMKGLSHAATSRQVARFYHMLAFGQLVSKDRSEQMLEILMDPALHHKFVHTYEKIAPRAKLFRKSGSWKTYHSDSIMVWGPRRQYVLVALVEDADGENIIRQIGRLVDEVVLGK